MCTAFQRGARRPLALMKSADRIPIKMSHSMVPRPPWVLRSPVPTGLSSPLSTLARLVNGLWRQPLLCRRRGVGRAACQQRPGDPRAFVGQCDGDHLRPLALEQPGCPGPAGVALPGEPQNGGRADDQEAAQVSVALLADPDLAFGPATTMRFGRQPEPSGKLAAGSDSTFPRVRSLGWRR